MPDISWTLLCRPSTGARVVARVAPWRYGKRFAYAFEIDDGPRSTLTVAQPLLSQFSFTDAPPGIPSGKRFPFVGGAAAIAHHIDAGNDAYLDSDALRALCKSGWAILNHSYSHIGNHWEPSAALTDTQIRRELFWSQAIFSSIEPNDFAPTHFVYPNGYMAHAPHLREFGLVSGSRVGGESGKRQRAGQSLSDADFRDLDRNYLDESVWAKSGDPAFGLPISSLGGAWWIDFTHGIDADPGSANHRRWRARLDTIVRLFGDRLWCAPTSELVLYKRASAKARLEIRPDRVVATVPEEFANAGLTIELDNLAPRPVVCDGATIFPAGSRAWVTLPAPRRKPGTLVVRKAFSGAAIAATFAKPISVAAVRVSQRGELGAPVEIRLIEPGGRAVALGAIAPGARWGVWNLLDLMPSRPPVLSTGIELSPSPALIDLEVWEGKG